MTELAAEALCHLLATRGLDHYDEEVTQLDHALQTAALAANDGAADELVVAALFHDIGHLLAPPAEGDDEHEKTGASVLAAAFGPAVAGPVALHVQAKRYLVAAEPGWAARLSEASRLSLALQGGPFTPAGAARFAALPAAADAIALRRWDDDAKVVGAPRPPIGYWQPTIDRVLAARAG
ncbi:MAG TPA: HD domain-containing protein [Acidimicrobiales bacterium]|nr:HD domain-containing protein [Acidimicrobiales bacterium]